MTPWAATSSQPRFRTALLLESGVDVGVVSRILGHSTVSLTLDIHGHLTDRMIERAAAPMDAILEAS
ncbi:MAG: hypothetical protein ABWY52_09120 [Candidatus Limnocylindrales bacterium]